MRILVPLPLLGFLLGAAPALSQKCPDVDPASGYAIAATFDGAAPADSAWLATTARVAAYRWKVPSKRRDTYAGWERVRRRLLPPEPRWADDWSPNATHRALYRVVMFRDGRKPRGEILKPSGDKWFDQTLGSIVDDPMPASPALPGLPTGSAADSTTVVLMFGETPTSGVHGLVRFAAVQTSIELERNSLRVLPYAAGPSALTLQTTVKYDVRENGTVDYSSIEFLSVASATMERAIRDGLRGARFSPPTSNCRPIAQTVVQTFGR